MSICNSWSVSETRLHIVNFSQTESRRYYMYSIKGKSKGNSKDVFSTVHWSGSAHICSYTSLKLMMLQNIKLEEALLSKGASVTMKQTLHPV